MWSDGTLCEYKVIRTDVVGGVKMGMHDDCSKPLDRDGNLQYLAISKETESPKQDSTKQRKIPGR